MIGKDPQNKHTAYVEYLAEMIKSSGKEFDQIHVEQEYGEFMDFEQMQKVSGQIYGDFDILIEEDNQYICLEVKTNPYPADLKKGQSQLAKASHCFDEVKKGLLITDKQIDELEITDIEDWDFSNPAFSIHQEYLTEKDKSKNPKPLSEMEEAEKDYIW